MIELSPEEEYAIKKLVKLSKLWPDTLWLFSGAGTLHVMKKKDGIAPSTRAGSYDQHFSVETIKIENDGGDW